MRKILVLCVLILVVLLSFSGITSAQSSSPMSISGYCNDTLGIAGQPYTEGGNWRCADGRLVEYLMVCSAQYGMDWRPYSATPNDPYTWGCVYQGTNTPQQPPQNNENPSGNGALGDAEFDAYCRSLPMGYSGAHAEQYDWYCDNSTWLVTAADVCRYLYGPNSTSVGTTGQPYSWSCSGGSAGEGQAGSAGDQSGQSSGSAGGSSGTTSCPQTQLSRGDIAVVSNRNEHINLRSQPSLSGSVYTQVPSGTPLTLIGNAICADGWIWYETQYNGYTGYVAEIGPSGERNILRNGEDQPNTDADSDSGAEEEGGSSQPPAPPSNDPPLPTITVEFPYDFRYGEEVEVILEDSPLYQTAREYLSEESRILAATAVDTFAFTLEEFRGGGTRFNRVCFVSSWSSELIRNDRFNQATDTIDFICVAIGVVRLDAVAIFQMGAVPERYIYVWADPIRDSLLGGQTLYCHVASRLRDIPESCRE